ncbi:MAG: tetratricopeptide repeat protein [Candidatus Hodarchaeota archaeon]
MPQNKKFRVCTETEKKKAEMFNKIDEKISNGNWDEALANLKYLFRSSPSHRSQVKQKLALIYFQRKEYSKTIAYLQNYLPTNDLMINRMIIECLRQLGEKKQAILHIARAPLNIKEKQSLMLLISPKMDEENELRKLSNNISQITIRCPYCTKFLFFIEEKLKCLYCDMLQVEKLTL